MAQRTRSFQCDYNEEPPDRRQQRIPRGNAVIRNLVRSVAFATVLFAGSAQAANEYYVRVYGIAGTSLVRGLTDFIEVQSWSLGFDNGVCEGLQFVKQADASSADLTGAALSGTVFSRIVLLARKPGEQPFNYMRVTLSNSVITSFKTGGSRSDDLAPTEVISARPSSVRTEIYGQDEKGTRFLVATSSVACP